MTATILLSALLVAAAAAAIARIIKNKREGKHSCGGNCAGCGLCDRNDRPKGD